MKLSLVILLFFNFYLVHCQQQQQQQGQVPVQQNQQVPVQQQQVQHGQVPVQQPPPVQQMNPGQVPIQQALPGQVPMQQPLPGQVPMQQPLPGQVPMQQPLPGQVPMQQPLPGQVPMQQPLPGQFPMQQPLPGQVPMHQPLPGQVPMQQPLPGQVPMQQPLPGQLQLPPLHEIQQQFPPGQVPMHLPPHPGVPMHPTDPPPIQMPLFDRPVEGDDAPAVAMEYKVHVDPGKEECYYQYVQRTATIYVSFQVLRGGDGMAGFAIRNPQGHLVHPYQWKAASDYQEVSGTGGYYGICVDNQFSRFAAKLVNLYITTFRYDQWEKYAQELKDIDVSAENCTQTLQGVNRRIQEILQHQQLSRGREARDYNLLLDNNTYVQYWSLAQIMVVIACFVVQVYFVKKLFETKGGLRGRI